MTSEDGEADIFIMPDDWSFYQATLAYNDNDLVEIAGEPFGSVAEPTVTLHIEGPQGSATLFLDAAEASEVWTALGDAIKNASGKDPARVELICDADEARSRPAGAETEGE